MLGQGLGQRRGSAPTAVQMPRQTWEKSIFDLPNSVGEFSAVRALLRVGIHPFSPQTTKELTRLLRKHPDDKPRNREVTLFGPNTEDKTESQATLALSKRDLELADPLSTALAAAVFLKETRIADNGQLRPSISGQYLIRTNRPDMGVYVDLTAGTIDFRRVTPDERSPDGYSAGAPSQQLTWARWAARLVPPR